MWTAPGASCPELERNDVAPNERIQLTSGAVREREKEKSTPARKEGAFTLGHTSGETFFHDIYIKQEKLPVQK